jgi:ribosome maturation factor RimP
VSLVGGNVIDVTWFLTSVLVTLDEDLSKAHNPLKASGPTIEVRRPADPLWIDPNYPTPEEIFIDRPEGEVLYERETAEEAAARKERKRNMYAKPDEDDPEDEPHIPEGDDDIDNVPLYMNEESRDEIAYTEAKESKDRYDALAKNPARSDVNTAALSIIAGAIIDALEDVEQELQILSRHELVLSSPGPPHVLDTQKQFDAHRGQSVIVETQDPWQSNRVLKGKLLDRNSMDVLINKEGRMVTIPHNFVRCVRVRPSRAELAQWDDLDGLEGLGIDEEEDLDIEEEELDIEEEEDVDSDVGNLN